MSVELWILYPIDSVPSRDQHSGTQVEPLTIKKGRGDEILERRQAKGCGPGLAGGSWNELIKLDGRYGNKDTLASIFLTEASPPSSFFHPNVPH
ncbi:hypothetical protein PROFUN_12186 [Planoprotostelium fungivorum]|uniref:Uncharacterized protein n=1 Tax=Planoprotostelium fungivorum TaxID=1890364 RepID=A0A2P6N8F8_9EUKA|nr:hypothetical protein PROFUN_12186 [Planoprotostelium fungivorum]